MKKALVLFSLSTLALGVWAQQNRGVVRLKGTLVNFSNQVEVEDMSDLQYLVPPKKERVIIPDTNGNFSITFPLTAPNYFRIGRNQLYLSPGDQMEVYIDKNAPVTSTFDGKGSVVCSYLRKTPFPKGGSYISARNTPQATIDNILQQAAERKEELDELNGVPSEFKRLEYARIQADILNSLVAGKESYLPRKLPKDSLELYKEEYKRIVDPLIEKLSPGFVDASFMKLVVYRDVADVLLQRPGKGKGRLQIKDWMQAQNLIEEMRKISDKPLLAAYKNRIDSIRTKVYHDALSSSLQALLAFGKGDPAVDFTALDINGNKVPLSSLKGKVIYVDLWATWCGPCLAEMPHFESLKEKYKDNPNVAFVSLSIDDGTEIWKSSVERRNAGGIQWQINRKQLDAYNVVGIPRLLLIDKDFRMVDMNAPLPSSKESAVLIDRLLKL